MAPIVGLLAKKCPRTMSYLRALFCAHLYPERYAAYIKERTKAVATSVGKVRKDKT